MPIIWDGSQVPIGVPENSQPIYGVLEDGSYGYPLLTDQADIDKQYDKFTQEIHRCLEVWFQVLEAGITAPFIPLANYPKTWTDRELDDLVMGIDEYVEQQRHWCNESGAALRDSKAHPYDAHCGFTRLDPVQRLVLAQDLDMLCRSYDKTTGWAVDEYTNYMYG